MGKHFREQRKYAIRHLRTFGLGKTSMDEAINFEAKKLADKLSAMEGKPIDIYEGLNLCMLNVLWMMLTGESFNLSDKSLLKMNEAFHTFLEALNTSNPITIFITNPHILDLPIIRKITGFDKAMKFQDEFQKIIDDQIQLHWNRYDPNIENRSDLLDVIIAKIKSETDPDSSFYGKGALVNLSYAMIDMFLAGGDTPPAVLSWAFLYLVHFPDIQQKIHDEIDQVIFSFFNFSNPVLQILLIGGSWR